MKKKFKVTVTTYWSTQTEYEVEADELDDINQVVYDTIGDHVQSPGDDFEMFEDFDLHVEDAE